MYQPPILMGWDLYMNLHVKFFLKKVSDKFFWGQHPETALRYAPAVKEIKKRKLQKSKILEIGSGSLGIVPYFKGKVDGIDINFSGPQTNYLHKIKGSATSLPFKNNAYDVSISVDVLEHINPKHRSKAVFEQLRITNKLSIIIAPCGKEAHLQDISLRNKWNKLFEEKNQFFDEHVIYGLPKKNDVLKLIETNLSKVGKKGKVNTYANLNLFVRNILMRTWITKNKFFYYLYLKGYLLFIPLLKYCNFGKTYRQIFVIEFAS